MTKNELDTEIRYTQASMIAKSLYEKGLLTREEYCQIDTILLSNILPKIGALCPISCKQ